MSKKLSGSVLSVILLHLFFAASAQSYVESALLFSRTKAGGSARIQGMGSVQTALGGDYSSAFSNPAGLGLYNRSEFTFSPAYTTYNSSSSYLGNDHEEIKTGLNIPGVSLVFNVPKDNGAFLGGSFALTLTRTNDFNSNTIYSGLNENTSIIDYFIDDATGYTDDQFQEGDYQYNRPTGLAYYNYLIGPVYIRDPDAPNATTEYFSDVPVENHPFQQEEIRVKGATNQWSISYGANFMDKVFIGGGIGISTLRYESKKIFTEDFADPDPLRSLRLQEDLEIRGSGINATLGLIARPVDYLQIGLSFKTPTFYQLTETYSADMSTDWNNFSYTAGQDVTVLNNESAGTDIVTSDYNLTVPSKFSAGVAFISKMGLISADIELTNPGRAKYSSNGDISYSGDNDAIKSTYKSVANIRIGGEYRYEIFRVRAGYGLQGNPYNSSFDLDNKIQSISAGFGVRTKKFFADFAWTLSKADDRYVPYSFQVFSLEAPVVDLKNKVTNAVITLGFTF